MENRFCSWYVRTYVGYYLWARKRRTDCRTNRQMEKWPQMFILLPPKEREKKLQNHWTQLMNIKSDSHTLWIRFSWVSLAERSRPQLSNVYVYVRRVCSTNNEYVDIGHWNAWDHQGYAVLESGRPTTVIQLRRYDEKSWKSKRGCCDTFRTFNFFRR